MAWNDDTERPQITRAFTLGTETEADDEDVQLAAAKHGRLVSGEVLDHERHRGRARRIGTSAGDRGRWSE
jgi:hypothetical protein